MKIGGSKITSLPDLLRKSGKAVRFYDPVKINITGSEVIMAPNIEPGDRILIYNVKVENNSIYVKSLEPVTGRFLAISKGKYNKKAKKYTDNIKRIRYQSDKNNVIYERNIDDALVFRCKLDYDSLLMLLDKIISKVKI